MKKVGCLLCVLLLALLLPVQTHAAMLVDPEREVSLQISFLWEEEPLSGTDFSVFQVCSMDVCGRLTPLELFSDFDRLPDIQGRNDRLWQEAAAELECYLLEHPEITPTDTAATGEQGIAAFPSDGHSLPQGLYLVKGVRHTQDHKVYSTAPFFVLLPNRDGFQWDYHIEARAKPEQSGEQISLRVIKIWEDKYWENRRPDRIWVHLYCDEEIYDTVILPQNGKWAYQWAGLDAAHRWRIEEEPVEGYTAKTERSGNTFYITNTYAVSGTGTPTLPQTGQLWWPVPVLLCAGLLLMVLGKIGRKRYEKT